MAIQKITADVISSDAITTNSISDSAITAAKLAGTLDLTGKTITVATASSGDNDTSIASTAFVQQEIASLVDSAPGTLNTLNELAAALGDDANFSTTVTNSIATKAPLASPTFTGTVTVDTDANSKFIIADGGADAITLYGGTGDELYIGANAAYKLRFKTDGNIVMDNGGSFGIGTSSPDALLHLSGGSGEKIIIEHATAPRGNYIGMSSSDNLEIAADEDNLGGDSSIRFRVDADEKMRIRHDGKVDIGNSTALYGKLTVTQSSGADTDEGGIGIVDSTNGRSMRLYCSSTTSFINSGNGGGQNLVLNEGSGNVGIGGTPDTQLNIKNADDAVVRIESIGSESGDDARLELKTTNGTFTIQNDRSLGTTGVLTFAGNVSNNIAIDHDDGTVGIGFATPSGSGVLGTGHKLVTQANTNSSYVTSGGTGRLPAGLEIATQNTYSANDSLSGYAMQSNGAGGATMGGYIGFLPASTFSGGSIVIGATTGSNSHAERIRITNNGLTFNGDTAAANALDDYEEGTWTPVVQGGTTTGTGTYSTQSGTYRKIGSMVHITCRVEITNHTGTGHINITGLPFSATTGNETAFNLMYNNLNTSTGYQDLAFHLGTAGNTGTLFQSGDSAGWTTVPMDTSFGIIFNGTYTA